MKGLKKVFSLLERFTLLLLLIVSAPIVVKSQARELIWPALKPFSKVSWRDSVYLFTQFQTGELIFDTGFESPQKHILNYNLFSERMNEITSNGDTVLLDMVEVPHAIHMAGYVFQFFPKKGYMRLLAQGKVSLAIFEYFNSGYLVGATNGYSTNVTRYPLGVDNRKEESDLYRSYARKGDLYLIADNQYYHATRANILDAYKEKRGIVKSYLNKHEIDFFNADTLTHLIHFLNNFNGESEKSLPGSFLVKAGEAITKHWHDSLYSLPQFIEASIKTSPNSSEKSLSMNYNLMTGKIDYLNSDGDTLQFNSKDMSIVNLDNRFFYRQPDGTFAEMILQGKPSLFEVRRLKVVQVGSDPVVPEASTMTVGAKNISRDRLFALKSTYFFLDQFQHSWPVNKAIFIRFFPKSKKKIDEYLMTHPVNFQNKRDLIRLISFCQQF
ncbi:MAG: hypothetical protein ABI477_08065 [Chryseolinea sp.]